MPCLTRDKSAGVSGGSECNKSETSVASNRSVNTIPEEHVGVIEHFFTIQGEADRNGNAQNVSEHTSLSLHSA